MPEKISFSTFKQLYSDNAIALVQACIEEPKVHSKVCTYELDTGCFLAIAWPNTWNETIIYEEYHDIQSYEALTSDSEPDISLEVLYNATKQYT